MPRALSFGPAVFRPGARCATLEGEHDVKSCALADAFWNHVGSRSATAILHWWSQLKVFARFAAKARSIDSLVDVNSELIAQYIEWLNAQTTRSGTPWSKSTRASAYNATRILLHWLQRCRPTVLQPLEYPYNSPRLARDAKLSC
jgi:hypothetical protein